jgi:uncharacterized protein YbbK (DUF523 family)
MARARTRLRLGVSACLLGEDVRWDGGNRRDPFVVDVLGPGVEWVAVCPEVELGLGVPREPIHLAGRASSPRLVSESGKDLTRAMLRLAEARVRELALLDLDGYVTKRRSPSCGLARVPVRSARGGAARRAGVGLFARVLRERLPLLPIVEEPALADPARRARFLERALAYRRRKRGISR